MEIQNMETSIFHAETSGLFMIRPLQIPYLPENARPEPMLFQCEVMFGSPSSNCGGNGICKIVAKNHHPLPTLERTSCSHARAFFAARADGDGASLLFRREWLCSTLMRRHFRYGILQMPEPCAIPPGIVTALGLKFSKLPAGAHLIEDYGTHYRINFCESKA